MSQELVRNYLETLSDQQRIFLFGITLLNQRNLVISWDIDQVLAKTEIPVLDYVDRDLGTKYSERKITGWDSISKWIVQDGLMNADDAVKYENEMWSDPKILLAAKPNKELRNMSLVAAERNIEQFVTTSRKSHLADSTLKWMKFYFGWIPENHVRVNTDPSKSSLNFKSELVAGLYRIHPEVVHLDDSMMTARQLLSNVPGIGFLGFPAPEESFAGLEAPNHIFFPDISIFEDLLMYSSM